MDSSPASSLGEFSGRSVTLHSLLRPHDFDHAASAPGRTNWSVAVSVGYGNIWATEPDRYTVDGEWMFTDVRISRGITETLEAGVFLPFSYRTSGFLDDEIEDFHDAFGLDQDRRDEFPRDRLNFYVDRESRALFDPDDSSYGINDIPVYLNWRVRRETDDAPSLVLQPRITLPAGDKEIAEGLGTASVGLALLTSKRLGTTAHRVHASIDASYADTDTWNGIPINETMYAGTFVWEYRWSGRTSLIAEYQVVSGLTDTDDNWSDPAHHITAGLKRRTARGLLLECGLQENLFTYNNSTDVALRFALSANF